MARELITAEASPIMRATKLADLANRFANTKCGRPRMQLDQAVVRDPSEQGLPNNYGLIWTALTVNGSSLVVGWRLGGVVGLALVLTRASASSASAAAV